MRMGEWSFWKINYYYTFSNVTEIEKPDWLKKSFAFFSFNQKKQLLAGIYQPKIKNRITRTRFQTCSNLTIGVILVSLLLILIIFHTLFKCFYCYIWTCNFLAGMLQCKVPATIYLLKVNNRNTKTRCEIFSKLTIKTPERYQLWNIEDRV